MPACESVRWPTAAASLRSVLNTLNQSGNRVFLNGLLETHTGDVGDCGQPSQHVRELLLQIGPLLRRRCFSGQVGVQRRGQFSEFFREQEESGCRATLAVGRVISIPNQPLETFES